MTDDSEAVRYERELGRAGLRTFKPAIPYVLNGPDLLVRSDDRVLVVFFRTASEQRVSGLLEGRIVASLLAYPSYVEPVLVLPGPADAAVADWPAGGIRVARSPKELESQIASRAKLDDGRTKHLRAAKQFHMQRFARIASISEARRENGPRKNNQTRERVTSKLELRTERGRSLFGLRAYESTEGTVASATSVRAAPRAAKELTHASFASLYSLHAGVPQPKEDVVRDALWTDASISLGREYALWFALIHAVPGARR
jgi:hypothetical protein